MNNSVKVSSWSETSAGAAWAAARLSRSPGGRIEKAAPVDVSNVMLVCPVCGLPTRVGIKVKEIKGETVRVRVCKRDGCGQEID